MTSYSDLKDKIALVTGGANGIGTDIVRALHGQGARVHFCDVDGRAGAVLAKTLQDRVHFAKVDLRKESGIKRWIAGVAKASGRIDILINNAARDPRIALEDTTVEAWDELLAVNLRAYFLTIRESSKWMPRGSAIVNFSSVTVHEAPRQMAAYVSTKSAIIGLTRSLARELGPRHIRVNTLSPGWIMTERQLREHVTAATKRLLRERQCIPDLLQPGEIAQVALFLASDASRAITGQEILCDRGWYHS